MEIQLRGVTKFYDKTCAVKNLSLTVRSGAFHFLLGPSGCGKTTTLRMLAGLENVSSGKILFDGTDVTSTPAAARGIGMVFQNYALWPHMTVKENIEYGLKVKKLSNVEIKKSVDEVLEFSQLTRYVARYPGQLSGGQQQRVALARALAIRPKVLFLDEPLSNLDAKLRLEMRDNISRIHRETQITMVYVTHDQKEALSMGTDITVMYAGEEVQSGTPRELYVTPKTAFLAGFIGETNLLDGIYLGCVGGYHQVQTHLGLLESNRCEFSYTPQQPVTVSIRHEAVKVHLPKRPLPSHQKNIFKGAIKKLTYLGECEQIDLEFRGDLHISADIYNVERHDLFIGKETEFFMEPDQIVILPEKTVNRLGT